MPNRHLADTGLAKFIVPPPKDFSCSKQIATSFISGPPKMTIHPIKPYFNPCVGTNYGYMIADMYKLFILTTLFWNSVKNNLVYKQPLTGTPNISEKPLPCKEISMYWNMWKKSLKLSIPTKMLHPNSLACILLASKIARKLFPWNCTRSLLSDLTSLIPTNAYLTFSIWDDWNKIRWNIELWNHRSK